MQWIPDTITDSWLWSDARAFRVWVGLLLLSDHDDYTARIGGRQITVRRGQVCETIRSLAEKLGEERCFVQRTIRKLDVNCPRETKFETKFFGKTQVITIACEPTKNRHETRSETKCETKLSPVINTETQAVSVTSATGKNRKGGRRETKLQGVLPGMEGATRGRSEPSLPPHLDTVQGREQLERWLEYKREQWRFRYKPAGYRTLLKKIAEDFKTVEELKAGVDSSISNGYSGLFPPKGAAASGNGNGRLAALRKAKEGNEQRTGARIVDVSRR